MDRIVVTFESDSAVSLVSQIRGFLSMAEAALPRSMEVEAATAAVQAATAVIKAVKEEVEAAQPEPEAAPEKPRKARKPKAEKASPRDMSSEAPVVNAPLANEVPEELLRPDRPGVIEINRDTLRELGSQFMARFGVGATVELLKRHDAAKLSLLPESKYEAVYREMLAGLNAESPA